MAFRLSKVLGSEVHGVRKELAGVKVVGMLTWRKSVRFDPAEHRCTNTLE